MTVESDDPVPSRVGMLLSHPDVREVLRQFAATHQPGVTADEFLSAFRPRIRTAGHAGRSVALKVGVASKTSRQIAFAWTSEVTAVAVVAGLVGSGVLIESVEESGRPPWVVVVGQVPSSPAHFGGTITCEVGSDTAGSLVFFDVVFPGQAIAWGAGRRLIKTVASTIASAAARISLTDATLLDGPLE
jgi:hypothetical protein